MILKIIAMVLACIGILITAFALYLLIVALIPGFSVPRQPLAKAKPPAVFGDKKPFGERRDIRFQVRDVSVSAWLYLPEKASPPFPCIIMANGLGGTKDIILESYARRFQGDGYAVLSFDYRYFGDSDGEPRQLIWIPHQLEDWGAAVEYARHLEMVDPKKIALWGTSLSGGHVIVTAAKDHEIVCVAAQCPGLDGRASAEMGFETVGMGKGLRLIMHGQRDLVRSWLGLSPHKIPIVGNSGNIALMTTENVFDFFEKAAPDGFVNEACARILIRADKYRPVKHAPNVRCPVLLQICDHDSIIPACAARETEKNLGEYAEVKHYPIGHFAIYKGRHFEQAVSDQLDFFQRHL